MKNPTFVLVLIGGLLSYSTLASDIASITPPKREMFDIKTDKWMALHHFSYHAARYLSSAELRGLVLLDPQDSDLLKHETAAAFAPVAEAYAPYIQTSILHNPETRAIAKAISRGHEAISDEALRGALTEFMPVYEMHYWPRHQRDAILFSNRLNAQIAQYGPQTVSRLTTYLERDWPNRPIRVDIVPYANFAGAYTDDKPAHITLGSNDPDIKNHALEIVFHEASHTGLLAQSIDSAAERALANANLTSNRYWHYLLFYVSGRAVSEATADPDYAPYAWATGLAAKPGATRFYEALEHVWDSEETLVDRATAAAVRVATLQTEQANVTDDRLDTGTANAPSSSCIGRRPNLAPLRRLPGQDEPCRFQRPAKGSPASSSATTSRAYLCNRARLSGPRRSSCLSSSDAASMAGSAKT